MMQTQTELSNDYVVEVIISMEKHNLYGKQIRYSACVQVGSH